MKPKRPSPSQVHSTRPKTRGWVPKRPRKPESFRIDGTANSRPEPAHSVSTLSARRVWYSKAPFPVPSSRLSCFEPAPKNTLSAPYTPTFSALRVCFTPVTPVHSPSRPFSFRRFAPVSGSAPPVPFCTRLCQRAQLRRVSPSGKGSRRAEARQNPCPHGVFPSEALPFVAADPASRLLLSRA